MAASTNLRDEIILSAPRDQTKHDGLPQNPRGVDLAIERYLKTSRRKLPGGVAASTNLRDEIILSAPRLLRWILTGQADGKATSVAKVT